MELPFFRSIIFTIFLGTSLFGCNRNEPSNAAPVAPNSNISGATAEPSATINPLSGQRITFESADKVQIVGSFFPADKPGSPAVLLLHQFASDRHAYDQFAKRMQAKGFGVLAIDGRGFGESVKTTDGKSVAVSRSDDAVKGMRADVAAAFEFLAKQQNVDAARIGIVGASYGSSLAIIYAAENPKVKAVMLLSPGINYFGNMPTEPAVKSFGNRSLLLVAADDDSESAEAVRQLKNSAANDKYETKIYKNGGHGTGLFKAKVGIEDLLEQFLTKSL